MRQKWTEVDYWFVGLSRYLLDFVYERSVELGTHQSIEISGLLLGRGSCEGDSEARRARIRDSVDTEGWNCLFG